MPTANDIHRTFDAGLHLWIAGWAVGAIWLALAGRAAVEGY